MDRYVYLCGCVTFFDGIADDDVEAPSTRRSSMHFLFRTSILGGKAVVPSSREAVQHAAAFHFMINALV